jgi:hypothetical protein
LTDVVRLGESIVEELQLASSTDTLGRWMAHRIAELITAATTADSPEESEAAQSACMDTILALWRHRSAWPQGWPPPTTKELVDLLADIPVAGGPWAAGSSALGQLQTLHHEVLGTIADSILVSSDDHIDQRWHETFGEELDPAEREIIEYVTTAPNRLHRRITQAYQGLKANDSPRSVSPADHLRTRADEYRTAVEHIAGQLEATLINEGEEPDTSDSGSRPDAAPTA